METKEIQFDNFPGWYTIDEIGLDTLCYFLKKEYPGKTVFITVREENDGHF